MSLDGTVIQSSEKVERNDLVESFTFPDGNVYKGDIKNGEFHGQGTIYFQDGSKYSAEWHKGSIIKGVFTFADGLEFQPEEWSYCHENDQRFYYEQTQGLKTSIKEARS